MFKISNPILDNRLRIYKLFTELAGKQYKFDHKYFLPDLYDRDIIRPQQKFSAIQIRDLWAQHVQEKKHDHDFNFSMYTAVPHCHSKCTFCMYNTIITGHSDKGADLVEQYTDDFIASVNFYAPVFQDIEFTNYYAGGGTTSMMNANQIDRMYNALFSSFRFKMNSELTWEANPDTTSRDKLEVLKRYGINRVSFGVQSLNREVLANVNRDYQTTEQVHNTIAWAHELGMICDYDLMAGLPGETAASFLASLNELLSLGPSTISVYPFVPTWQGLQKHYGGKIDLYRKQYDELMERLPETQAIAQEHGYIIEGFASFFVQRGTTRAIVFKRQDQEHLPDRYLYNGAERGSCLGLGYSANSYINGKARYHSYPLRSKPEDNKYQGVYLTADDEKYYYILETLASDNEVDLGDFQEKFAIDLGEFLGERWTIIKNTNVIEQNRESIVCKTDDGYERFLVALLFLPPQYIAQSFEPLIPEAGHCVARVAGYDFKIQIQYNPMGENLFRLYLATMQKPVVISQRVIMQKIKNIFSVVTQQYDGVALAEISELFWDALAQVFGEVPRQFNEVNEDNAQ